MLANMLPFGQFKDSGKNEEAEEGPELAPEIRLTATGN
jgi:hypothetical protein